MSWVLAGSTIPSPHKKNISLDIQSTTNRALGGAYSRDYIGDEKKVIECTYDHISLEDYQIIETARQAQIDSGTNPTLAITEDGFTFSAAVIIDLPEYDFHIPNHYEYRNLKMRFIEI